MTKKVIDLTGNIYGEVSVICRDYEKEENSTGKSKYWKCKCLCGKIFSPSGSNLRSGTTKSCGCKSGGKGKSKNTKQNEWIIEGNAVIGITSKNESFTIDLEEFDKVKDYCWRKSVNEYIIANGKNFKNEIIWIHRVIMNPSDLEIVDHRDWDKTNNRKNNFIICTNSQNNVNIKRKSNNTSGYTGVKKNNSGKWVSQISYNNKRIHLGTFETIEEAIVIRSNAEKVIHKDFNGELNRKDLLKMIKDASNLEEE